MRDFFSMVTSALILLAIAAGAVTACGYLLSFGWQLAR